MQANWQAMKRVTVHTKIKNDIRSVFGPYRYDFRVRHINGEKVLEFKLVGEPWSTK
jgi:hypothetical protein